MVGTERTIYAGSNRASSSVYTNGSFWLILVTQFLELEEMARLEQMVLLVEVVLTMVEYFEWKDGNSSNEDRVGLTVKLDGNKIVLSSDSDNASDIIGVISGKPAVEQQTLNGTLSFL